MVDIFGVFYNYLLKRLDKDDFFMLAGTYTYVHDLKHELYEVDFFHFLQQQTNTIELNCLKRGLMTSIVLKIILTTLETKEYCA